MSLAATNLNQQFGKYRLLKKLAQGGMAEIFLAIQQGPHAFEKVVVIKRMLPELCVSFDFVQMFLDEARVAARLDHPNIIRIYDFGDFEGQYYLAMEYVPGEDLASIVQQCKRTRAKIPVELVVDLTIGAAEGLHHAHEMEDGQGNSLGVVHRDVSPSNIICGYQGAVKVLDFGVARAKNNISKTSPGVRKGTPQYLAPEQALGEGVDRRADIFALGLVMHELLTGNRLFQRENEHATISAIIGDDIVPPSLWRPELPAEIDRVVMKAMSRNPAGRYPTALEMAADLSAFLAGTNYLRGSGQMDFLTSLFGEERKREKQRLALGIGPEEMSSGPNLAPLRDTGAVPNPIDRPPTGPGRASDRPSTGKSGPKLSPSAPSTPSTGKSGPKGGLAAVAGRRSNPQLVARRSNPQLAAPSIPSVAPAIAPLVPMVPLPSPAAPSDLGNGPASNEVPAVHKPVDNGAARPLTPASAKKTAPAPAPSPARSSGPRPALTVDELFSDLEDLPKSGPLRTPSPPAPAHGRPRTPVPAPSEPPRAEPVRAEAPRSAPVQSEPPRTEPPPSASPGAEPLRVEPAKSEPVRSEPVRPEPVRSESARPEPVRSEPARPEPVRSEPAKIEPVRSEPAKIEPLRVEPAKIEPVPSEPVRPEPAKIEPVRTEPTRSEPALSPAPSSAPLSAEAPPAPAKRRSPLPFVAAAVLGVGVLGGAFVIFGKGSDAHQTQVTTPPPGPPATTAATTTGTTTTGTTTTTPPGPTTTTTPPKPPPAPTGGLQVGGLKLMNLPAGATATLDGDAVSDPSKERYLPAGTHALVVEAKGFLPFKTDVEVVVGSVKQVQVDLKPQPVVPKGTLEINCQPWCQITVDKKDSGKTSPAKLVLTAGSHTLVLANPPAGLAKTIQVVVPEGGTVTKVVKLEE